MASQGKVSKGGYKHADITAVPTTGASEKTSKSLPYSGERASHHMASSDLNRMNDYKETIVEVGCEVKVDPAIIAGIISRESGAGRFLEKDGTGDHGNGYGLMQVDKRHHTPAKGAYSREHIKQGAEILQEAIGDVSKRHPTWSPEMKLKGGIAAYNFGVKNVQTQAKLDVGTTGDDYSSDVVARAQFYRENGY